MRLACTFVFPCFVLGDSATFQKPLKEQANQYTSPFNAGFDQKAEWVLNHFDIPGLAVAVSHGEVFSKVSHPASRKLVPHRQLGLVDNRTTKGYGISDTLTFQPVTEHTLFFTGSTTKAFTSAAMSLLVDDDISFPAINWNTLVHTVLPADFELKDPWATSQMTIVDILSHRSGLPRHDWVWLANITLQDAVQSMRDLPFTASPRTEWQYCNLMYSVASHLIETVTNKSLETFLTENIWLPLNMTETYLSLSEARKANRDISQGFFMGLDGDIVPTNRVFIDTIRGAGNILSSVSDYAKWISTMLNRGDPFSQAAYDKMFGGHSIVSPNPVGPFQSPTLYGLGWMSHVYNGELILFHDGSQFGYGASVMLLPQRKFGLVLLGNNMNGINAAANVLAYHLIDEELGVPLENRFDWVARGDAIINDTYLPENVLSDLFPKIPQPPLASPLNFSSYEGFYTHPAYPELRLSGNCTRDGRAYRGLNRTTPDLCAFLTNYNDYSRDLEMDLFHVSGTHWLQIALRWGVPHAARVEFLINPDGSVGWLGIEIEPLMAERGEKIWWRHL